MAWDRRFQTLASFLLLPLLLFICPPADENHESKGLGYDMTGREHMAFHSNPTTINRH